MSFCRNHVYLVMCNDNEGVREKEYDKNYSDNQHLYSAFCLRIQSAAAYYYGIRKIVTVTSLHQRVQLAKCAPYQYLDCNISHDRYLPDVLSTVNKAIETKYLAQRQKHVGTSGAQTHGLVIPSPALFH